jgi:hypothetical protein
VLAAFEPKIGEGAVPNSDRVSLAGASPTRHLLRQPFAGQTGGQVGEFAFMEANVRDRH